MKMMKLSAIVLDFTMYPRRQVDSQHVSRLVEAIEAGAQLPPLVVDGDSKRLVDGFHRHKALRRVFGDDHEALVVVKAYDSEADLFLDAVWLNADHGRPLSPFDRRHVLAAAQTLGLDEDAIADALRMTVERLGDLKVAGFAKALGSAQAVPLKRTIRHKAGQTLTKAQAEANAKLDGMRQAFYVNQLITLVESDLLDTGDEDLMARVELLKELLDGVCVAAA